MYPLVDARLSSVALAVVATTLLACGRSEAPREQHAFASSPDFEISVASDGVPRVGQFILSDVEADPRSSLDGIDRALGSRGRCRRAEEGLIADWPELGVSARLIPPAGEPSAKQRQCNDRSAYDIFSIRVLGRRWHTNIGLRIGDDEARITALYPGAVPMSRESSVKGWRLASRHGSSDDDLPVAAFAATIRSGTIASFVVLVQGYDL